MLTPLMTAACLGNVKTCEELLKAGADPSVFSTTYYSRNALHMASGAGKHEVIPVFAAYKQLLNAKDANGDTPLLLAAYQGHAEACNALLKAGADPFITDNYKRDARALADASTSNAKDEVIKTLKAGIVEQLTRAQPVVQKLNAKEETASIAKIRINATAVSIGRDTLNQKTGDVTTPKASITTSLETTDAYGLTPLLKAAQDGDIKLCTALLTAGANPNATNMYGQNVLHIAARRGYHEIIPIFAGHKQLFNAIEKDGINTPLMLAACCGHLQTCEALLKAGADPSITGKNGQNALHGAATRGKHEVIPAFAGHKHLLNAIEKEEGFTPLMEAASWGHPKVCEALLKIGADPTITDKDGRNVVHIAASSGKHEVIQVFAAHKKLLNAKSKAGDTPLMLAASNSSLEGHLKACEALLKTGADRSISKGGGFLGIGGTNALDLARTSNGRYKYLIIDLLSNK